MGDDVNVNLAMHHRASNRLQLPLLLIELPANSRVNISQDDSKMHLRLHSDHIFKVSDETILFQKIGLTRTDDQEVCRIFDPEMTAYLKS